MTTIFFFFFFFSGFLPSSWVSTPFDLLYETLQEASLANHKKRDNYHVLLIMFRKRGMATDSKHVDLIIVGYELNIIKKYFLDMNQKINESIS